ncbi:MmcQ/YjbR family DNA-binding protein [Pseudomonas sp. H11T01]|uniref:MmcQ/YjbR family DNA-binding protein n=1 Tax=Pseudomonas sp. H11T01 TaxID=3402749 RepID=UPI003ACE9CBD
MNRQQFIEYVHKKYKTNPDYPWAKLPDYAVFRHSDNEKWYALVMDIPSEKIGIVGAARVDVLELKVAPESVGSLRKKEGIYPAYHMNKEHWITVLLNGPLDAKEIHCLVQESFELTR